ncbi:MAG: hypothetical protein ABWZ25_13420 [Chitinophagaceae bacterium]
MQFKKTLQRLLVFIFPIAAQGQTTFLAQGDKQNILVERLEIKASTDSVLNFSKTKPFSRNKYVIAGINSYRLGRPQGLSRVDEYNIRSAQMNNLEYIPAEEREEFSSRKPILKHFYTSPANLFEVHVKDFDLAVNPVIQYSLSKESDNDQSLFLNTRGLTLRGNISQKIGFFAYMTDNQERDPVYVQQYMAERSAVPGAGFYKPFKAAGGADYFDARGYFTFNAAKYIDITFGYDKNFIGNGHRSLFLSDFGANYLFLKLNTRIWKFNFQNIFMELHNAHIPGGDRLIGKKYAAMHHLDVNLARWLNVGLFEGVVFGRTNRFDFSYLNPIIFYRSIESQNGSFDNSVAGLDLKANLFGKFQFYGQFLLDEFSLTALRDGHGWWANKYGIQLGAKYIDAFGISNLDLQFEFNKVRPFTYSHRDSVANYTHYNQPLAHPLMANFNEVIGIARYQPAPKWLIQAKAIYYRQGLDSNASSNGSNIFLPNVPPYRERDYGYGQNSGWLTNTFYGSLLLSYEIRENMFLEFTGIYRKRDTSTPPIISGSTTVATIGFRWNMHRREFDF